MEKALGWLRNLLAVMWLGGDWVLAGEQQVRSCGE